MDVEEMRSQIRQTEVDRLWGLANLRGISRRRFLWLLLAGGTAAVLAACGDEIPIAPNNFNDQSKMGDMKYVFKDPAPFIRQGRAGLEARLESMPGLLTPTELFFVRNNSRSVDLSADDWSLTIEGDAVESPLQLSYEDILRLPSRSLVSYLECAGNQRVMFDLLQGRAAPGEQWGRGAVSNGEWLGVSLADVLALAGIRDEARSVLLVGLDRTSPERGFRRVLPVEQAVHPDTILAYGLNGEPLPKDHGYPLRAIVPGWVGSSQIKWLGRIEVSSEELWTRNNTTSYVLVGDDYEAQGEAAGTVISQQTIKSALALPWPAELSPGRHNLQGFAHSPRGEISSVEWSDDGGASWREALVARPQDRYSWAAFGFDWDAASGERTVMTRATDVQGNTQPDRAPFNEKGYLFNQPLPHPISVV